MAHVPHILFVDDEINILSTIKRNLHQARIKWKFSYVQSAKAAMALLESTEKIDVVVTDVMMPEVNGYELVKTILEHHPDVHPLVLSGHCNKEDQLEFEKLQVPFFSKPFPIMELTTAISLLIGTHYMNGENKAC
jgi:DNA-binding NtrC family response regulator